MDINTSINNGKVMVNLKGSMYVEDAGILREKLITLMESGQKQFVIDLSAVQYIDSSGLGVLVAIQKRIMQLKGSIIITGANGLVKELFELTRLNKIFTMQ